MCLNPVHILSPKLKADTYICGCDKYTLDVPCGHCPECNNKRVNDLVFRCYYEYLDCNLYGGFTLFQTLTYSLQNSPFSGGFRFFRKDDITKFIKRVRKRLDYLGYDVSKNLKYVVTCEYGSSPEHMHLPHYHVLFFSKVQRLDPYVLDKVIHDSWKHLGDNFSDTVELGFVDRRDTELRIVNSIYGLRYVCKYIYKGTSIKDALDYNKSSDISQFIRKNCVRCAHSKDDIDKWRYENLQDWQIAHLFKIYKGYYPSINGYELVPFLRQSRGLGMSFLETCSLDELLDVVQLPSQSPTGFAKFSVPLYYIRKAFYDYDKNSKRFILNELGKDYKKKVSSDMVDSYKSAYSLNSSLLDSISNRLYKCDYQTLVASHLLGRSFDDFAYYAVYLKDRQVPQSLHFLLENYDLSKDIDVKTYALDFNDNALDQSVADSPNWCYERYSMSKIDYSTKQNSDAFSNSPLSSKIIQISLPLHNVLPRFQKFDDLYEKLQKIKYEFTLAKNLVLDDKYKLDKSQRLVRSILSGQNSIIY